MPARMRDANNSENEFAMAPRMLARPTSTRHTTTSRALPNRSAAAPSTGCTIAKVKANTDAKPAAVAMVTPKSSATCGSTGSSARADRLAAKVASAMILRAGGMRLDAVTTISAPSARRVRGEVLVEILGQRVEPHQGSDQDFEFAQRHHVGPVRRRAI